MKGYQVTQRDIDERIDFLNKRFKKSNRTAIKFDKYRAYGGTQIVLKQNKPYGSGQKSITQGFQSPRECLNDLDRYDKYLSSSVKSFHDWTMGFRRNRRKYGKKKSNSSYE